MKRNSKLERIVAAIKRLTVAELIELNKLFEDEGIPPIGTGVPAKPKTDPPRRGRSQAVEIPASERRM